MMSAPNLTPQASWNKNSKAPSSANHAALPAIFVKAGRDELTNIEGIDAATEMALNSIGIRQFSDFRGYTPETLAQLLQTRTGLPIDAATIAGPDWISWAEMLATENKVAAAEPDEEKAAAPAIEKTPAEMPAVKSEETKIAEAIPQLKTPDTNGEIKKPPMALASKPDHDLALHVQSAKFTLLDVVLQPKTAPVKILRSEIQGALSGTKAGIATFDRLPLCIQIHAVDTLTGEHKLWAAKYELLQPDQMDYGWQLEFAAPKLGRYQLQVIAFLLNADSKIALYQGPILRVIA